MNSDTKVCPSCAEEIKRAAKVCPRCRQWQTKLGIRHPGTLTLVFCLCIVLVAVSFTLFMKRITDPKPAFGSYRGQIAIIESKMAAERSEKDAWIIVFGIVTNQTPFSWKDLEFDCRYFDSNGTLIDAKTIFSTFTLSGHGESGFRLELKTPRTLSEYASHKVAVKAARNAAAWP